MNLRNFFTLKRVRPWSLIVLFCIAVQFNVNAQGSGDVPPVSPGLEIQQDRFGQQDTETFHSPPAMFHPETWFHFIGGNVAAEGVSADVKAIDQVGIMGLHFFHGDFGGDWPGVEPQIEMLSPEWEDNVQHLAEELGKSGVRFTMQNCPGWAMAGGPWIKPKDAMRHLVWSRVDVEGGKTIEVEMPQPQPSDAEWRDYREVSLTAFPTPEGDINAPVRPVEITSNHNDLAWNKWLRNEEKSAVKLESPKSPTWVEVTFDKEITLRTVQLPPVQSFNHSWCYDPGIEVKVEAVHPDGTREEVARVELPPSNWQGDKPFSLACSEVQAQKYRLTVSHKHFITFRPVQFFTAARKINWEAEAAWVLRGISGLEHPKQLRTAWVDPSKIVDLTGKMNSQGTLQWDVPPGDWTILRWGHVNTGMKNGPAPAEATGFECNKLSKQGAEAHFAGYIGDLTSNGAPLADGLLKGMLMDSWECRTQTWTYGMDREFEKHRGYSLMHWLPAVAGYVIEDPETTSRFLRDWRATINDLLVQNFYGHMTELAHSRGLSNTFETAVGDVFPGDIMEYYKHADIPMCEFWHPRSEAYVGSFDFKPVKPCVSAARLYGKTRVAAEAFTSFNLTWNEHPRMLKPIVDIHFARGVTHPVFHTYTHYPRTDFLSPGTSFGACIGTPFLREQTWWKHMPEFTNYLARCNYLLERGKPVSDVLFYLGDELGHKPQQDMPFPDGYQYDYCNTDVLLNRLSVKNNRIVTPEGISYRLLWLRDSQRMLPETLERMLALVKDGAVLLGGPPEGLATLSGGHKTEERFRNAVNALWGKDSDHIRRIGKGMVMSNMSVGQALERLTVEPDVRVEDVRTGRGEDVDWLHRKAEGSDWYFVAVPQTKEGFTGTLSFRAGGMVELWNPVTGEIDKPEAIRRDGGRTLVDLDLSPDGSVFVVFRKNKSVQAEWEAQEHQASEVLKPGPWRISFPSGWGAPDAIDLDELKPWKELDLSPEARAFSGTATYTTEFEVDSPTSGFKAELNLGQVEVIADVRLNGKSMGKLWTQPYSLDVTKALKPGTNHLEVEVTSTWFNRLVYDAQQEKDDRKTWTICGPEEDETLVPYGLLGPVNIQLEPVE